MCVCVCASGNVCVCVVCVCVCAHLFVHVCVCVCVVSQPTLKETLRALWYGHWKQEPVLARGAPQTQCWPPLWPQPWWQQQQQQHFTAFAPPPPPPQSLDGSSIVSTHTHESRLDNRLFSTTISMTMYRGGVSKSPAARDLLTGYFITAGVGCSVGGRYITIRWGPRVQRPRTSGVRCCVLLLFVIVLDVSLLVLWGIFLFFFTILCYIMLLLLSAEVQLVIDQCVTWLLLSSTVGRFS